MKLGKETPLRLYKIEVELRTTIGDHQFNTTMCYEFNFNEQTLKCHPSADVAAVKYTGFQVQILNHAFSSFQIRDLADSRFFSESIFAMDMASFIGFPGKTGVPWYDEQWKLAVARTINIASFPKWEFTNRSIPTKDALLVSGLSFSGSSGSPVLSHEKGIRLGEGLIGGNYCPPKVIGIMSGHWWNEEDEHDAFKHSGLSYFTRSTSILDLLQ